MEKSGTNKGQTRDKGDKIGKINCDLKKTTTVTCECGKEVSILGLLELCRQCKRVVCSDEAEEERISEVVWKHYKPGLLEE